MSSESDAGIDKQRILDAIAHPDPLPFGPLVSPSPALQSRPPSGTRRAIPPPAGAWELHRTEISAIVAAFVALIWISAGVAGGSALPILIGIVFGVGSLAIWLLEVWSGD